MGPVPALFFVRSTEGWAGEKAHIRRRGKACWRAANGLRGANPACSIAITDFLSDYLCPLLANFDNKLGERARALECLNLQLQDFLNV